MHRSTKETWHYAFAVGSGTEEIPLLPECNVQENNISAVPVATQEWVQEVESARQGDGMGMGWKVGAIWHDWSLEDGRRSAFPKCLQADFDIKRLHVECTLMRGLWDTEGTPKCCISLQVLT